MRVSKEDRPARRNKDMFGKHLRSRRDVEEERDSGRGVLSFGGDTVEMMWNMNEHTIRDQIFKLRVPYKCGGCQEKHYKTVWVDAEELRKYLRWI